MAGESNWRATFSKSGRSLRLYGAATGRALHAFAGMAKVKPSADTSKAKERWSGFRPVAYRLSDRAWKMPIERCESSAPGEGDPVTRTPTTVGDAFKQFNGWLREDEKSGRFIEVEGEPIRDISSQLNALVIETDFGERRFSGTALAVRLLEVLVGLRKEGINPWEVTWFFYDKDSSLDASECFTFFVVSEDGKIVNEGIGFFRHPGDRDLDPAIFEAPGEGTEPIWRSEDYWRTANTISLYRKFYTETKTGQLMVLRPDEPILYHYERPQAVRDVSFVTMVKIYRLLLITVPVLVAIAFPSVRDYVAMAAAVLGVDFLLLCWRTRKAGRL